MPGRSWAEMGKLWVFAWIMLRRWRRKEGGCRHKDLAKCAKDAFCHTQRSVSIEIYYPWTKQDFDHFMTILCTFCRELNIRLCFVYSKARWLSWSKMLFWVFEPKAEILVVFLEKHLHEVANKFGNEQFLMKLAYLSNIFGTLIELNLQASRQKQAPSSPSIQDQSIHLNAWDVGQATWSSNYWLLWKSEWISWNQWYWRNHIIITSLKKHISSLSEKYFPNNSTQR